VSFETVQSEHVRFSPRCTCHASNHHQGISVRLPDRLDERENISIATGELQFCGRFLQM
jgi:hypothetical protein